MREYKVGSKVFQLFADAREEAEDIMAGLHDDDFVDIFVKDGEDFFEPYGSIVREKNRFVLKREKAKTVSEDVRKSILEADDMPGHIRNWAGANYGLSNAAIAVIQGVRRGFLYANDHDIEDQRRIAKKAGLDLRVSENE